MTTRRTILVTVLILAVSVIAGRVYWARTARPLNVILVTLDTTRADHLGVYGYKRGLTSKFDEFAKRGVVFDRAYAPAPITLPSHSTMLTGLYPPEHGLRLNGEGRLPDDLPFLPSILQKRGFDTAAFVAAFVLDSHFGLARGFDVYDDDLSKSPKADEYEERRRDGQEIVDSAIQWLKKRDSRPFFCWIHLFDAHGPYNPRTEKFGEKFSDNPYDAGVATELQAFDQLVSFLQQSKLDRNTLVIVAADHGEGLDEHLENEHAMLVYNTTLHVPLIFVDPRECQKGLHVTQAVSLVDLMPTILDLIGIPVPSHLSGRSLRAALHGEPLTPFACYAEAETPYVMNRWCPLKTVIFDRWKYIQTNQPELYDLQTDSAELVNLADSQADKCQELQNSLELIQASFHRAQAQRVKLSATDNSKLETLGYVASSIMNQAHDEISTAQLPDVKEMLPYLAQYEKARLLGLKNNFLEAIPMLQEITQKRPDYAAALLLLGNYLFNVNRIEEAVAAYRPAIELRPDFLAARMNLARSFWKLARYDEAAAELRAVILREPENSFPHHQLAEVLRVTKQYDDSVAEYKEAIRISPDYVPAYLHLGQLLAQLDRSQEAASNFEKALAYEPGNEVALTNLLKVLLAMREYDKALDYCQKSAKIFPASFDVRYSFGFLLALKNRQNEALGELREAHKLRPDDPRPMQLISRIEAARKSPQP